MKQLLFTIHDSIRESYSPPMLHPNDAVAKRSFAIMVNDPNSMINKTPGDYIMYCIGEYDTDAGELIPQKHVSLGTGLNYINKDN